MAKKYKGMISVTQEEAEEFTDLDDNFSFNSKKKVKNGSFLLRNPGNKKKIKPRELGDKRKWSEDRY